MNPQQEMLWLDPYVKTRRKFSLGKRTRARSLASFVFLGLALVIYAGFVWLMFKFGFESQLLWIGGTAVASGVGALGYFLLGERNPRKGETWASLTDLALARFKVGMEDETGEQVRYYCGLIPQEHPPSRNIYILPSIVRHRRPLKDGEKRMTSPIAGAVE